MVEDALTKYIYRQQFSSYGWYNSASKRGLRRTSREVALRQLPNPLAMSTGALKGDD